MTYLAKSGHTFLFTWMTIIFAIVHPAFLISDVSGVIVLTWSVRMSHSPSQTDRHTDLNFGMEVQWKNSRSSS